MTISVIIPTYNEQENVTKTIETVKKHGADLIREVIVVDGRSKDKTVEKAKSAGARVLQSPQKGRAVQMNFGARHAEGEILYFLHADSLPPENFAWDIINAAKRGIEAGCFQLEFDQNHILLKFYAWFTRFDINAFRFGDQSLFVTRTIFQTIGGFREDHIVMEDQEIVRRIKKNYPFKIMDNPVVTSARKYEQVGVLKLQMVFAAIFVLYNLGVDQRKLVRFLRNQATK